MSPPTIQLPTLDLRGSIPQPPDVQYQTYLIAGTKYTEQVVIVPYRCCDNYRRSGPEAAANEKKYYRFASASYADRIGYISCTMYT
jgi:hypothetical protein